jgi:DNA-binding CsgD family transcriptional regulator/PAS domain-containing protein
MYDRETVLKLIALIYDAASNPDAWPAFLESLAGVIGGHFVSLGYVRAGAPAMSVAASARWDPAALGDYVRYYGERDPWKVEGIRKGIFRQGFVALGEEVLSEADLQRTEFYNDYARKFGLRGGLAGVILNDGQSVALINAPRLPNTIFGGGEIQLFKQLLPHLERALQIHQRLTRLESEREATADAFDQLPGAMILADLHGRIVLINEAASAIVRVGDGLSINRGHLVAKIARENAQLQRLVAQCAVTTIGKGLSPGGALTISRPSGKRSLHVLVTALRTSNLFAPRGPAAAAIFVSDPEQQVETDGELLRQFHGLTPAEARLASLLARGLTLREATAELSITANTGRGYLKNIFSKTETRTQAQLVRLVLSTPAIRRPR